MTDKEYVSQVNRTTFVTLGGNAFLAVLKLLTGFLASSAALVSDGINSFSDCFSGIIVLIGVHISAKKSDKEHPYGHERLECVAALILAAILICSAFFIEWGAVRTILEIAAGETVLQPTMPALIVALFCIFFKGGMYLYTEKRAKKLNSAALHGCAVDHLSDSLSSVGAAVGIVGALCSVFVLEPIASVFIGLLILKSAWDICRMAVDKLIDKAADDQTEKKIAEIALSTEGVERIDVLRTRQYSNKIFVDLEIAVQPDLSLIEAHRIAERVHERVEHGAIEEIKHCMVHVNPTTEEDNHELPQDEM